jgi:hypothetical protein
VEEPINQIEPIELAQLDGANADKVESKNDNEEVKDPNEIPIVKPASKLFLLVAACGGLSLATS